MTWALVTGGSSRGGAAICRVLHGAGLNVVVHHSPASTSKANVLLDELVRARPDSAKLWQADLSAPVEVPDWLIGLEPQHCVCNASVYRPSDLGDATRATQDWAVHVASHAVILSSLKPTLRTVTAITDIHIDRPARGYVWYTVAKSALQTLALALSLEWAPRVRCNVVSPGAFPFPDDWSDDTRRRAVEMSIPLDRIGRFEELAETVRWLTLDAHYVTGQVIAVDGGRSRWLP